MEKGEQEKRELAFLKKHPNYVFSRNSVNDLISIYSEFRPPAGRRRGKAARSGRSRSRGPHSRARTSGSSRPSTPSCRSWSRTRTYLASKDFWQNKTNEKEYQHIYCKKWLRNLRTTSMENKWES